MADKLSISGTDSPYTAQSYTAQANDKNTISMTGFFQLLATQLQNQDMSNPMDNSEIMAQMTQMAMVQSMTSMTDAIKNTTAVNTQTYAAGLVGQEVTMAVTEENAYGQETPIDVKYAKVEWVNFTSGNPTIKVEGDDREYQLSHLVGMGRVPNPFKSSSEGEDVDDKEDVGDTDKGDGTAARSIRRLAALRDEEDDEDESEYDSDLENDLTSALI